jgi:distribution and morphology protein 10
MMGHISSAYSARVSRDLSLSSRFDFNVYSYESEWTMGAEWWMRRSPTQTISEDENPQPLMPAKMTGHSDDVRGVVKARASTNNVSFFKLTPGIGIC